MSHAWLLVVVGLLHVAALAVLMCVRPLWVRAGRAFSVVVDERALRGPDVASVLRRFRRSVAACALAGAALIALWRHPLAGTVASVWVVLGTGWAFRDARRRCLRFRSARRVPGNVRSAELSPPRVARGRAVAVGPYVVLASTAVALWISYDAMPDVFPVHYGATGRPDRWVARSVASVFLPLAIGLVSCLALRGASLATVRFSRRAASRHLRVTIDILLVAEYALSGIFACVSVLPLLPEQARAGAVLALVLLSGPVLLVAVALMSERVEPSGASGRDEPDGVASAGDAQHGDERHWRGGLVYSNPDDPALFVPKLVGIGYTLNFGHRGAWLALGAMVAVPVGIAALAWFAAR